MILVRNIPWKGLPALENLVSSPQEGLFPSIFGAKTPFLGLDITPPTHCLGRAAGTVQKSISVPGNVEAPAWMAKESWFSPLINEVVHQGTITWPPARHIPGISSGEDTWSPAAAGRRVWRSLEALPSSPPVWPAQERHPASLPTQQLLAARGWEG